MFLLGPVTRARPLSDIQQGRLSRTGPTTLALRSWSRPQAQTESSVCASIHADLPFNAPASSLLPSDCDPAASDWVSDGRRRPKRPKLHPKPITLVRRAASSLQRAGRRWAQARLDIPICFLNCPSEKKDLPFSLPGGASMAKSGCALTNSRAPLTSSPGNRPVWLTRELMHHTLTSTASTSDWLDRASQPFSRHHTKGTDILLTVRSTPYPTPNSMPNCLTFAHW